MEGHECKLLLPILLSGDEHYFVFGLYLCIEGKRVKTDDQYLFISLGKGL